MKRILVLGRAAVKEFDEATDWYKARDPAVGEDFVEQVRLLLTKVEENADRFPVARGNARKAVMPDPFPYTLYFTIEPKRVVVVSIFHQRRNPTVWQNRL